MANFANLTAKLNLNIANFASNMQRATAAANKFASNLQGKINAGMVEPAKKAKFEFKDVARIVQGIMISKAFYGGLNAIRSATNAVWEFSKSLEYSQMVYSNLFGDSKLANEFINVLKDFSAVTPFTFKETEAAAKRLLAYGIQYKNVMFVMQGVLAAATVQGNSEVIEPISRALGQIYTKGRLMNEEMRQLAEAGIPVYDILQEKLGLTVDQLRNLGRVAIPANTAINALVEGINERFGSTLANANKTTQGIISNISDNAVQLFSGIFAPFTTKLHNALAVFGDFLFSVRKLFDLKGLGGVFEALIPKEFQGEIRSLVLNLRNLWDIVKSLLVSAFKTLGSTLRSLIKIFNALAPVINMVLGTFAGILKSLTDNERSMRILTSVILGAAAAWVIFKMQALAAAVVSVVAKGIATAIRGITSALNFLVAHPIWALLAVGVGLLVALTGASDKFSASINNMLSGLSAFGGKAADILLPETRERTADVNKFNNALGGTSDAMDKLAGTTGKAGKAAKSLLGFDEVFSIKSPDEGIDGIETSLEDFISGFSLGDIWQNTDFGELANGFVNNLLESFGGKDKLLGAGIGALLGAGLGMVLGGPTGAKIGAIAGAIAGYFWDEVSSALGLTDIGSISLPIAAVLGTAIGFIAGGPLGAVIGAAIGSLVGWIIDSITRGIQDGDWSKSGLPIGIGLGAAIGMIAGGPAGAALGAAIGALIGWIVDEFIKGFSTGEWNTEGISTGLGTVIGGAIGMIAFGPAGAVIGAAIGTFVGWIVGLIIENWNQLTQPFKDAWTTTWTDLGPVAQPFVDAWNKTWDGLTNPSELMQGIYDAVRKLFDDTTNETSRRAAPSVNPIAKAFDDLKTHVLGVITDINTGLLQFSNDTESDFRKLSDKLTGINSLTWTIVTGIFTNGLDNARKTTEEGLGKIWQKFLDWSAPVREELRKFFGKLLGDQQKFVDDTTDKSDKLQALLWGKVNEKFGKGISDIAGYYTRINTGLSNFWSDLLGNIGGKLAEAWSITTAGISKIYKSFKDWKEDLWNDVFQPFFDWIERALIAIAKFAGVDVGDISGITSRGGTSGSLPGHAKGGVFNREHIARFAEGNKAEAAIPLQDSSAMQPFVDAISDGITASLLPILSNLPGQDNGRQILYVGTLIADDRGLKELDKKLQIVRVQDNARRGLPNV